MDDFEFFTTSLSNPKTYKTDVWDYWDSVSKECPSARLISETEEWITFQAPHRMEPGMDCPPTELPEDLQQFLRLHNGGTLFLAGRDYRIMSGEEMISTRVEWAALYPSEFSNQVLRFCDLEDSCYFALVGDGIEGPASTVVVSEGLSDESLVSWVNNGLVSQGKSFRDWLFRLVDADGVDSEAGWDWAEPA